MKTTEQRRLEALDYIFITYRTTGEFPTYRYVAKVFNISYSTVSELIKLIKTPRTTKLSPKQFSLSSYE